MNEQNLASKLVVTVTSVPGQPTLEFDGELSNEQIARIVQNRFGVQENGVWAMPHSFCGAIVPTPAHLRHDPSGLSHPHQLPFLTRPGHNRVV